MWLKSKPQSSLSLLKLLIFSVYFGCVSFTKMKNIATVFLILFSFASLLSQEIIAPQDESFDPAILKEPPLPMLDNTLIYEIVTDLKPLAKPIKDVTDSVAYVEKMGWKVQVFSSSDYFLADSVYRTLQGQFGNSEVEKVFNLPYYKIRIGNCATREEAERLLIRAQELGYRDAWVIRTQVKMTVKEGFF